MSVQVGLDSFLKMNEIRRRSMSPGRALSPARIKRNFSPIPSADADSSLTSEEANSGFDDAIFAGVRAKVNPFTFLLQSIVLRRLILGF